MLGKSYYDTTHLPEPDLFDAVTVAQDQDAAVLAIMQSCGRPMSPSAVWKFGVDRNSRWILTSVRRSMTTLTKVGKLTKLPTKVRGLYNRAEFTWELVK